MNGEQRGFVRFVNQIQMTALSGLVSQIVWLIGSLVFTGLVVWLAVHDKAYIELAGGLILGWTGKSITNAASNYGVRTTAREYLEAKAKAAPAVHAENVHKLEVQPAPLLESSHYADGARDEHEWTSGDPRAGII